MPFHDLSPAERKQVQFAADAIIAACIEQFHRLNPSADVDEMRRDVEAAVRPQLLEPLTAALEAEHAAAASAEQAEWDATVAKEPWRNN